MMRLMLAAASAVMLLAPGQALAQKPIKVGYPMILSGPGALFGEPALKGAQMYVDEINGQGGVLGRKIELIPRDTKGNADE
ncbi:MAG TPA: ABC transporter substrate-binding protein, partial [Hyphomicrobiaceae bacterium]|nr:ABC transporter substrate-binding protein [Hyphomicrobiaceae bacterium]